MNEVTMTADERLGYRLETAAGTFAVELLRLRESAGTPSFRELAKRAHYSRTALSTAVAGRVLPSLPVTLAFVAACGGDEQEWRKRWQQANRRLDVSAAGILERPVIARPAGSPQAVVDGADPERAGCGFDAVTLDAQKVAISETQLVGQVQLRYSPWGRAAWSRFEGTSGLDHLATTSQVEIHMEIERGDGLTRTVEKQEYIHDYMWSMILLVGPDPVRARVQVLINGRLMGAGETLALSLS
ncbi:helix-turn-helix domain-containing protein [Micromonospora polyrhachis]|uniref:HTH cro/C1-type domain-containing protein n=1 Tax=Micromonospora polyrhachis TaxID=1282883 RepID=A0A7W7SXB5_9ACTN|nr:XRE family transcriptional regulator [Micromonospora polyrhachis]MBB4962037.1 hypothetical protein [Micromonospora polyrhachis]